MSGRWRCSSALLASLLFVGGCGRAAEVPADPPTVAADSVPVVWYSDWYVDSLDTSAWSSNWSTPFDSIVMTVHHGTDEYRYVTRPGPRP